MRAKTIATHEIVLRMIRYPVSSCASPRPAFSKSAGLSGIVFCGYGRDPLSGIRDPLSGIRDLVIYRCLSVFIRDSIYLFIRGYELWPARDRICAFCCFWTSSDRTRTFSSNPLFSIR